jgi:hypothetical protein
VKKEPSTFTKVLKYFIYLILVGLGLFIGKLIIDKMNDKSNPGIPVESKAQITTSTSAETPKAKAELKLMREDKNKYY